MTGVAEQQLQQRLAGHGLRILGILRPLASDGLPLLAGEPAQTIVLIGNVGSEIWAPFNLARPTDPDPLNHWTRTTIDPIAADMAAQVLYPFDGPPYWPFQQWAKRAGNAEGSPIGILLHRAHGLWHAYRAALLLPRESEFEAQSKDMDGISACDNCLDQPCLTTCPVGAFSAAGYAVADCWSYLESAAGADCMAKGCVARRSCPEVRENIYQPEHAGFHMTAFLAAKPKV